MTGPPRAGVSAVAAGLRHRMPAVRVLDGAEAGTTPVAVVFVVSAVAPLTESDCVLADAAAVDAEVVVAVVSKIDDHRGWREVLEAGRAVADRSSGRLAGVPWLGVAAAPRLGEPRLDDLVDVLGCALADPSQRARNALRARQFRVSQLQGERDGLVALRRRTRLDAAGRSSRDLRQLRLMLSHDVRRRCAALRADLLHRAGAAGRRDVADFPQHAWERCTEVLTGIEQDITDVTRADVGCGDVPVNLPPDPPPGSWRLERRLTAVLGAGFGLGVAMVVTRLVAGLAPGLTAAGLAAGGVLGFLTTAWVVRARALLHDRAVLQAWTADAVAAVRAAADERVGTGILAVEAGRAGADARSDEDVALGRRITSLDAEIQRLSQRPPGGTVLPVGRPAGGGLLNRSCE
ncbi:hypothetical protein [Mycolicibacterium gilvum]|uniref:hypothetical protein n=1 Tax=Mycolicibacterium gilvum TaxID=1804 RepID=UPI004046879F